MHVYMHIYLLSPSLSRSLSASFTDLHITRRCVYVCNTSVWSVTRKDLYLCGKQKQERIGAELNTFPAAPLPRTLSNDHVH